MKNSPQCVIVLKFGGACERSEVHINRLLAEVAESYKLPIIAQREVADLCPEVISSIGRDKGYLDTWGVLKAALAAMEKEGFVSAVLVAHCSHLGRASDQASKLGLTYTLCSNPPKSWDRNSKQWWTRSSRLWLFHELYTIPYLRLARKI